MFTRREGNASVLRDPGDLTNHDNDYVHSDDVIFVVYQQNSTGGGPQNRAEHPEHPAPPRKPESFDR
jgi:hypothetical protein